MLLQHHTYLQWYPMARAAVFQSWLARGNVHVSLVPVVLSEWREGQSLHMRVSATRAYGARGNVSY
jgi:hypothetical protein